MKPSQALRASSPIGRAIPSQALRASSPKGGAIPSQALRASSPKGGAKFLPLPMGGPKRLENMPVAYFQRRAGGSPVSALERERRGRCLP